MARHLERGAVGHNTPATTAKGLSELLARGFAASMCGFQVMSLGSKVASLHPRRTERLLSFDFMFQSRVSQQRFQTQRQGVNQEYTQNKTSSSKSSCGATICCWLKTGSPVGSHTPKVLAAHRMHDCATLQLQRFMVNLQQSNSGRFAPAERTRQYQTVPERVTIRRLHLERCMVNLCGDATTPITFRSFRV
jgi:hypothetical protein